MEIGTGMRRLGLWLLRGMRPDGVLTSVDIEAEHQRLARRGVHRGRHRRPAGTRLISGAALDVLPRLTDGAYDLVFCDADKQEYADYLAEALRLLRPGGVVAFDNALWHDRVADPASATRAPSPSASWARRSATTSGWCRVLLPVGDGLLAAVKRGLAAVSQPRAAAGCRSRCRPW